MPHLLISPDAASYRVVEPEDVIRIPLEGGPSRFRLDQLSSSRVLQTQWTLLQFDYQYFRAFFNTSILRGRLPFTCNLLEDDGCTISPHECLLIPGSMSVPKQKGREYVISATLEVRPLPTDDVANAALVAAYGS